MIDYLAKHWPILFLTTIYLAGCLGIGWFFRQKASRGVSEYYLAKREIPGWVISLAFFSTFASSNTYIGQAGQSFKFGLSWAWVGFFWAIFCVISWVVLGPKMRYQTAVLNSNTIPDYFQYRYKSDLSRTIRLLSAFVILFATIWYMVGIAKGSAHVMQSVLDIPYGWGAGMIILITFLYTSWGGMYSVLWTDAVQGIMMFAVAIIMVALPFIYAGGAGNLFEIIQDTPHSDINGTPIGDGLVSFGVLVSFFYILGIGLAVGMKQIAEPRCLIRFYSVDNAKSMKFAMIWTPVFLGISLICVMGLGALVHVMATPEEARFLVKNTDQVVGFMLQKFDHRLTSGIVIAGLFAAGMSSLASVMLIVGTAFISDIWHLVKPMKPHQVIPATKAAMLGYSLIVFLFTLYPPAGIVELTAFSGAVFAASFFPSIFGGLYLRWGTDMGAIASMVTGIIVSVVWRFALRFEYEGLKDIHEVIPAFMLSSVVYWIVSKWTANRVPDEKHLGLIFKG